MHLQKTDFPEFIENSFIICWADDNIPSLSEY